ncbi:ABC transporter ATP-binding protein [Heyndrickxia acidicola]|uniref:ATP-binding cassette domain-containing protein n=1 Tax=Heyndrickxia acidicola TaxID=209389 RepID=A0ABU6MEM1_9BACI|nr:ATP-binding cassette domain-containing protein [Heyndrickxia acidicola]MED1203086.1 ATP-binding cassette domain-containing protein [Heyndrickxia acidicola]
MTENMIEIKGLVKSFKDKEVLKGVDFEIKQSEIFALLGENGAGKTTTIKILATLSKMTAGTAIVNGFDVIKNPNDVRKSISLTGQFTAIDEILTGRENLIMMAKLRHLPQPKGIAQEMLEKFDLTEAADRKASTYSGGMKRRLDLAMSFIGEPAVIFLDEPSTGLDPKVRLEVWELVRDLNKNGATIFLTTQYLEEAEALADRIAMLHKGNLIANAPLAELKAMLPEAEVEYVKKEPTLEEIYLHLTGEKGETNND